MSIRVFTDTFLIFFLEVTLLLRRVATSFALVSFVPNPLIVNVVDPLVKKNLSAVIASVVPSPLI